MKISRELQVVFSRVDKVEVPLKMTEEVDLNPRVSTHQPTQDVQLRVVTL